MRHTLPIVPQFYVTAPQPCPYLEGRMERKLFTALQGDQAERLNDALQTFNRDLNISIHEDTGRLLVQVTDPRTGDVVRQIPPEQLLEAEVSISKIIGLFVNDMV